MGGGRRIKTGHASRFGPGEKIAHARINSSGKTKTIVKRTFRQGLHDHHPS